MDENNLEQESSQKESRVLSERKEASDPDLKQALMGAEILENPPGGSFLHGMQVFLAWINQLIGKGKQD